jgi:sugar O-acyltransferase (sialic acid O-acetyltransferase NeuD family)
MEKSKVVIYGIGKFADYVSYVLSRDSMYEVSAFCIETGFKTENVQTLRGLPIVDFENVEQNFPSDEYRLFIAVGNNWVRERIFKISKRKGYSFISYVSTKAEFEGEKIYGENVYITTFSGIQPFVSIGDNTIVLASIIGHHSKIGNNVFLSCCTLGGNVKIGDNSFLGINSTVKQNVIIGRDNIIGMGSNITKNTNDYEVYSEKPTSKRNISSEKIKYRYLR